MDTYANISLQIIAYIAPVIYLLLCAIFYARVHKPELEDKLGVVLLFFTFLGGFLGAFRALETGVTVLTVASILLIIWSIMEIVLDYVLKKEFRNPPNPYLLVPYLVFLFFPLSIFWTAGWGISIWLWLLSAFLIALMSYLSIDAARKGLG